jgi:hypothetical protein
MLIKINKHYTDSGLISLRDLLDILEKYRYNFNL